MDQYEILREIESQESDLETVINCDEDIVCLLYNADSKAGLILAIEDEIKFYKSLLPKSCEDTGMDYDAICSVQGLPRYS